jgi:hypothetical protein
MTKEERIKNRVERELAEANERLARLHGINPNDKDYQYKKRVLRYAFDHHVTVEEARAMLAEERKYGNDR